VRRGFKAFAIGAAALLLLSACEEEKKAEAPVIRAVKTITAKKVSASEQRKIAGLVEAVNKTVLSFEVAGSISAIRVKVGDRVKKGQELARLDDKQFMLNLQAAEAQQRSAQAALTERETTYKAQKQLYEKKVVAKAAYDKAVAEYKAAQETVKEATAKVGIAKRDLSKTVLRAPVDGVISKRDAEPANVVSAGKAVFELQGDGDLQVRVNVPDRMVSALKKGQKASISYPSFPQLKHDGLVDEVGARGEEANTFSSTVRIVRPSPDIRPGISAEVTFTLKIPGHDSAFALPISSFLPSDNKNQKGFVFVVAPKSNKLEKRAVSVLSVRGNDVLIGDGLKDGERVVIAGVGFLHNGMTVKLWTKQ